MVRMRGVIWGADVRYHCSAFSISPVRSHIRQRMASIFGRKRLLSSSNSVRRLSKEESAMMALPCFVWTRAMRPMMANVISGVP